MGWSHPDISLEDLMTLIKGFVDILILASGYQSSGRFAHWDSQNIKNAFQWGNFFENVIKGLSCSDDQQDSMNELDAALSNMKSNSHFPQGLAQLSSTTLSRARNFVLEHLIHTLPLRDAHLRAFLTATIEMDLDELQRTENDSLNVYLDKLMLQNTPFDPVSDGRYFMQESRISFPEVVHSQIAEYGTNGISSMLSIQEIMRRQLAVSCISSAETGLDILSKSLTQSNWDELGNILLKKKLKQSPGLIDGEQLVDSTTWNTWRTKNLSYFLDKRTIRLVSGASMVFSAPKIHWVQVLQRLDISAETDDDNLCETIELLLLGCTARRWSTLIGHFMSISYDSLTISRMYTEVQNLLLGRYQNFNFDKEILNSKEKGILEHLEVLLSCQIHCLWKLSPILAAMSIPSWSQLFKLYLSELEYQFKGKPSTIRCCTSTQDRKEPTDA